MANLAIRAGDILHLRFPKRFVICNASFDWILKIWHLGMGYQYTTASHLSQNLSQISPTPASIVIRQWLTEPHRGATLWWNSVVPLCGATSWSHTVESLCGATPRSHTVVPLRCSTPWSHTVVPHRGATHSPGSSPNICVVSLIFTLTFFFFFFFLSRLNSSSRSTGSSWENKSKLITSDQ